MDRVLIEELQQSLQSQEEKEALEMLLYKLIAFEISGFWSTGRMGGIDIAVSRSNNDELSASNGRRDAYSNKIYLISSIYGGYFVSGYGKVNTISEIASNMQCWMKMFESVAKIGGVYFVDEQKKLCKNESTLNAKMIELSAHADRTIAGFIKMHGFIKSNGLDMKMCKCEYSDLPRFYSDDKKDQIWHNSDFTWGISCRDSSIAEKWTTQ